MKRGKQEMDKSVQITAIIVIGLIILGGIIAFAFNSTSPNGMPANTISVNGQGVVKAVPDLVSVYFNIETKSSTSEGATQDNAKIVDELKANLVSKGFNEEDIKTQSFNVNKNYLWEGNQYSDKGYIAVHTLKLEIPSSKSDKVGDAIDAAVSAKAGISYVNFELSQEKQNEYKAEAIKLAAEDAKTKAQAVADGFDKNLGGLVSTSVNDFDYYPWRLYDSAESSGVTADVKEATTNINPTEQEVSATVTAVYKLR